MKKKPEVREDIYECKSKLNDILREYNCSLFSADEYHRVIIRDNDTRQETGLDPD